MLTFHVIPGYYAAADLEATNYATVNGAEAEVVVDGDTVTYQGATVTQTDILTSNAIVHLIDTVVMPPVAE